jgi:eukaryotic-like serine/threonine-protein kinase
MHKILNLWQAKNLPKTLGGRYRVVKKLAEGGFGQTFVAEDMHLPGNPRCVVKQLKTQIADPAAWQTARRLFDAEAKVLYQLGEHDQIPRLLAHFEENKEFYLAQELIEGEPLSKELIPSEPWPEVKVIAFLQDLLSLLSFVHQQQVIHRDIKPENLIRRRSDGKIVLIDFGAVKQVSSRGIDSKSIQTNLTISIGTQGYMPKEQLAGHPRYSSDVYAVGIIGIQALTGIHPRNWTEDQNTGEINWRGYVSNSVNPQLIEVLNRMVRYDFRARYNTAAKALETLRKKLPAKLLETSASFTPPLLVDTAKTTSSSNESIAPTLEPRKFLFPQLNATKSISSKISTIALVEQLRSYSLGKLSKMEALPEFLRKHPITQKQLVIGFSAIGLTLLLLKVIPIFQSDPLVKASTEYLKKAEKARKEGKYQLALDNYQSAINIKSDLEEAYWGRCYTFTLMGQYESGNEACNQALSIQPKYPEALWGKGLILENQQKYPEALEFYNRALTIDPKYTQAWTHKGLSILTLNRSPQAALNAFDKAIALQPDLAEAQRGRCTSLNLLGKYTQAIEACDKALQIRPKYPEALWNKGFALEKQQKYNEALKFYEQSLTIAPKYTEAWNHKGLTLLALGGNPGDILAAFEGAIALNPDLAQAHWGRCTSLNLMGQYTQAIEACDRALKIEPKYPEALLSKGFALEKQKKNEDALKLYQQALEINPQYTEAWNRKGLTLMALGENPKEILTAFDKAIALQPDLAEAYWGRCYTLNLMKNYPQAIEACDKSLHIKPKYPQALWSKGFALGQEQKYHDALKLYDQALEIDPKYAPAWNNRGVTLLALGRSSKEVLAAFEKAIALQPDLAQAHWGLCLTLNQIGQYQKAFNACNQALSIEPQYAEAFWGMGFALEKQQKYPEALEFYQQAVKINPQYTEAWNHIGLTLLALGGDPQEILAAFEKAIAIKLDLAEAHWGSCYTLNLMGQYEKAIDACDRALQIKPEYAQALWSKGFSLGQEQKYDDALKLYDQALEIQPKYAPAWNNRAVTILALGYPLREALKSYDKAIALQPDLAQAHWGRCYTLNLMKQYEQATAACDKALQIQPQYPEALWGKGLALEKQKKYNDALALYDKAIELAPEYAQAWNNRGSVLLALGGHPEDALAAFDRAISIKPDLIGARVNRGFALVELKRFEEGISAIEEVIKTNKSDRYAKNALRQVRQKIRKSQN